MNAADHGQLDMIDIPKIKKGRYGWVWLAGVAMLMVACGLLTGWLVQQSSREMRNDLLLQTQLLARSIDNQRIMKLSEDNTDSRLPEYLRLKEQFDLLREFALGYRAVYLLGYRDNAQLTLLLDSRPTKMEDRSPSEILDDHMSDSFRRMMDRGVPEVIGPREDGQGAFISGCVPLADEKSGETLALLVVDYDAHVWRKALILAALPALLLTLSVVAILVVARILILRRASLGDQSPSWMDAIETWLAFALGSALTLFLTWTAHQQELIQRKKAFSELAIVRAANIEERLQVLRNTELEGLASFFASSQEVTLEELQHYLVYLTRNPAVQAWEWIPKVPAADRTRVEAEVRAAGIHDFRIWQKDTQGRPIPAAGRAWYYPVYFAAPLAGNEKALGFDLGSEPVRSAALETAARTGLTTATDPITLVQETGKQKGMLVYRPVFANKTLGELRGFALAVLRMETMLKTAGTGYGTHLELVMLHPGGATESLATTYPTGHPFQSVGFALSYPILAFGKTFAIYASAGPGFLHLHPAHMGWITFLVGLTLTAALVASLNLILRRRETLEWLVVERTRELRMSEEQLRAQTAELKREKWRLQSVIEGTNVGSWEWNVQTGETFFNERWAEIIGYTLAEISPVSIESWARFTHPEDLKASGELLSNHFAGESVYYEFEARMKHKDGHWVWVFDRGKVFSWAEDGKPLLMYGTHQDITERKLAEMALADAYRRMEDLLAASNQVAIIATNREGLITIFNTGAERMLGYTAQEVVGRQSPEIFHLKSEVSAHGKELTKEYGEPIEGFEALAARAKRGDYEEREWTYVRKDGTHLTVSLTVTAVRDDTNQLAGLLGVALDITERKRAEQELLETNRRLEATTLRAQELAEAAEAASGAKSAFVANMSHEIRTPMNAIIGFAHLMKRDPLTARQVDYLGKLSDAAQHLLQIINDILDFSKIEAGKMTLEVHDFELSRIVDYVCGVVADSVAAKNLELAVRLERVPPVLRGDRLRLGQVLLNLVGNAVKFTEAGLIEITARVVGEDGDFVTLHFEVRDTGIGMNAEQIERLFQSFEQADESTTRRFGGTGLGLAISKRLVEMMNGTVGVESQPGLGSLFWLEVPLQKSSKVELEEGLSRLTGMRTLIVDDQEVARESLCALASELSLQPDAVGSGEAALETLLQADQDGAPYRLMIIDWKMPGMDGLELASRLQDLSLKTRPQFIMVSAYGDQLPGKETDRAGITRILAKPVTPSVLLDGLRETLLRPESFDTSPLLGELESGLARRHGSHILLVEDNSINQEVATQMLKAVGMRVSVAENGQTAVEMAGAGRYDLVLMDVQMPVMDGLQATVIIRRLPAWEAVPILAMTANAFGEDRERCLQAGMNEHLVKPVEPQDLYRSLIKWLPERNEAYREATSEGPSLRMAAASQQETDQLTRLKAIDGLDVAAGLNRLEGNLSQYLRLLDQFVERHGSDAERLSEQVAAGDLTAVRHTAHALKGVAGMLGATAVEQRVRVLEKAANERAMSDELLAHLGGLTAELSHLLGAIRNALPEPDIDETAATVDASQVAAILDRLEQLLAADSTEANELFEQHRALLMAAMGSAAVQLSRRIRDYDYSDALDKLRAARVDSQQEAEGALSR